MKNLDEKELKAINGGFIIWLLTSVAFSIIWETIGDPKACGSAMNSGADAFLQNTK